MRYIMLIVLLIIGGGILAATDFGATMDNILDYSSDPDIALSEKNKLILWLELTFSDNLSLFVQGSQTFTYPQQPYFTLDADILELKGEFAFLENNPFLFGFSLGRFYASEFSGHVFSHNLDGLRLSFRNSFMNAFLVGGFTGFLFKYNTLIEMSLADRNYESEILPLAPPRLVGILDVHFPELLLMQSLMLSIVTQFDFHNQESLNEEGDTIIDLNKGGKVDTYYFGIGLEGPILPSLYYNAFFYFQTGRTLSYTGTRYEYTPIYAFLTGGQISWYNLNFLKSKLELQFIYASGDEDYAIYLEGNTDSISSQFLPIIKETIGLVFEQRLINLFLFKLNYSIKPFANSQSIVWQNLQTELMAIGYFRSSLSEISDSRGFNYNSDQLYLGSEVSLWINFRPLSDLGLSLAGVLFFPNNYTDESVFYPEQRSIEFLGRFILSVRF